MRRGSHADEVGPARLGRRAGVGPVRGAHVRGLNARARPSYRTAYGQKETGAAGGSDGPPPGARVQNSSQRKKKTSLFFLSLEIARSVRFFFFFFLTGAHFLF